MELDHLGWCGSSQWIDDQQTIQDPDDIIFSAQTFFNNSIISDHVQPEMNHHSTTSTTVVVVDDHLPSNIGGINYGPYIANPYCGLVSDLAQKTTSSLDSLDCFISTTNDYSTDTSTGEDEDIAGNKKQELINSFFITNALQDDKTTRSKRCRHTDEYDDIHFVEENGKRLICNDEHQNPRKQKKQSRAAEPMTNLIINFQQQQQKQSSTIYTNNTTAASSLSCVDELEADPEAVAQMKEMIYRAAVFRPVNMGVEEGGERRKRKNVKISSDPQTVAARQRRERISERIRVLQKLVPGGSKMDTASMLDEAASYLKFLRTQVKALENNNNNMNPPLFPSFNTNLTFPSLPNFNHMIINNNNSHSFPMHTTTTTTFPFHLP